MTGSDVSTLAAEVMTGDRRALARAITLIESRRAGDRGPARDLLEQLVPASGKSLRVGISGVPGVGKSTFIESLGNHLIDRGPQGRGAGRRPDIGCKRRFDTR